MKRAFVLSICLLTAVVGMMAQTQNKFWRTTISTTGLYGACDEKGNSTIPNVFQRMGFWGTNAVSFIEYDSRFFVIDRKGEMVGGESWDEEPVIFDRFVMAGNKDERFLMDLHGNRLPVEGTEVTLMKGWNWVADNLMLHSKAADSTYQLHGIDGTLVVNECSTIELLNRLPLVKYLRKGTWGVCNLAGTEVVPCQYSKIEEVNLGAWERDVELMKKSKVAHMYSRKELADQLHIPLRYVVASLDTLTDAKLLETVLKGDEREPAYVPATDTKQLTGVKVLAAINNSGYCDIDHALDSNIREALLKIDQERKSLSGDIWSTPLADL